MMKGRVRFHPAARREYAAAIRHANTELPGRGQRLQAEVERTADRIAHVPEQGSSYLYGTPRFILHRFPYSTVYVRLEKGYIVAVAHHSRKPGYWRKRLRSIH